MSQRLGWPGIWVPGHGLYDDGGLPVHLYPFLRDAQGRGPLNFGDPAVAQVRCWCHFEGCVGIQDELGFPVTAAAGKVQRFPDEEAPFHSLAELLAIPWIQTWACDPDFYRFSIDERDYGPPLLMAEKDQGRKWWVVAIIWGHADLPAWEAQR